MLFQKNVNPTISCRLVESEMASLLGGVELNASNVEQAVLQFYQSGATQVSTEIKISSPCMYKVQKHCTSDGVRRVSGLRREPVVSVENPTLVPTFH